MLTTCYVKNSGIYIYRIQILCVYYTLMHRKKRLILKNIKVSTGISRRCDQRCFSFCQLFSMIMSTFIFRKIITFKKPVVSSCIHKYLRFISISGSENLLAGYFHHPSSPCQQKIITVHFLMWESFRQQIYLPPPCSKALY